MSPGAKRAAVAVEVASPIVLLVGWGVYSSINPTAYFPPLTSILSAFVDVWLPNGLLSDVGPSLVRLALGYLFGCSIGVFLGVLLGIWSPARRATDPIVQFLRAIPPPALLPISMLILGIGDVMKVAVIAFVCVWPVLIATIDGVRGVDKLQIDTATVFNVPRRDILLHVVVPAALPRILAGMRVSLALAIILMVITEMVSSTDGIGFFVLQAQANFAIAEMWSGILMLGLLGYFLNALFNLFEGRVLRWHRAARAGGEG